MGVLEQVDGVWRLCFARRLHAPPARVWDALTVEQDLAAWFPTGIEGEWRPGASLRFPFAGREDMPVGTGSVVRVEPCVLLEYGWGGDILRFALAPDSEAATRLALTITLEEVGKAARDAAGWHECLDNLAARV